VSRFVGEGVGRVEDDPEHRLAEARADEALALAALGAGRGVLEGVVEQGRDRFVRAAAAFDDEAWTASRWER